MTTTATHVCGKCGGPLTVKDGPRKRQYTCPPCAAKTTRAWREANPAGPGELARINAEWRARNPERQKRLNEKNRLRRYGLTPETHAVMLANQRGQCAICNQTPKPGKVLSVDHDHNTGRVRALLCVRCNNQVAAHESPLAQAVRAYLKEHA